jgi:transcriptional regulator with XRE-family HTH domain
MTGALLREARRRHGITQTQLAVRARTSQAAISRIERDAVSPTVQTLARLLDVVGEELTLQAEPVDYGHDLALLRQNLALKPEERIRRGVAWANAVQRFPRVRD